MTPKTILPLLLAVFSTLACGKGRGPSPAPPTNPPPAPIAAADWPETPAGPLWEALGRVPAGLRGTAGTVDYAIARGGHPEWTDSGHDRNAEEFERGVVSKFGIKPGEVLTFVWAEITFQEDGGRATFLMARLSTPPDRLRAAFQAASFERAKDGEEIWSPTLEKDKFVPQRILLKDGWLVKTMGGDEAIARIGRVWSGQDPAVRTLPHASTLVAAIPASLPAVLRFGTSDQPLPDSPLRVIAMSLAPDPATGEDVLAVAFNEESGPETMMASEEWKRQIGALTRAPKVDRRGRYLRMRTRPDADPQLVERQNKHVKSVLADLKSALSAREIDLASWPKRLDELWTGDKPYTTDPGLDPWGHPYLYRCPPPAGEGEYDLRSVGPDGKPDTPDDIS